MKNRRYWRCRATGACIIGRGRTFDPKIWEEITKEEYLKWQNR